MTPQQALVGLTSKKRLGTSGTWAVIILGAVFVIYLIYQGAKTAGAID